MRWNATSAHAAGERVLIIGTSVDTGMYVADESWHAAFTHAHDDDMVRIGHY